jgi:hypothetical protein
MIHTVKYLIPRCDYCSRPYGALQYNRRWRANHEKAREDMQLHGWKTTIVNDNLIDMCPACQATSKVSKPKEKVEK